MGQIKNIKLHIVTDIKVSGVYISVMSTDEKYPCYIAIREEGSKESVELPSEKDGRLSLTAVASQFPGATGLRFKSETGSWRGVLLNDEKLFDIPLEGWGKVVYQIVKPAAEQAPAKRSREESDDENEDDLSPLEKMKRMSDDEILSNDLVVLGIPHETTEDELRTYFVQFGT